MLVNSGPRALFKQIQIRVKAKVIREKRPQKMHIFLELEETVGRDVSMALSPDSVLPAIRDSILSALP